MMRRFRILAPTCRSVSWTAGRPLPPVSSPSSSCVASRPVGIRQHENGIFATWATVRAAKEKAAPEGRVPRRDGPARRRPRQGGREARQTPIRPRPVARGGSGPRRTPRNAPARAPGAYRVEIVSPAPACGGLAVIFQPPSGAAAPALRTARGMNPGLRGDDLLLQAGQEPFALAQGQTGLTKC